MLFGRLWQRMTSAWRAFRQPQGMAVPAQPQREPEGQVPPEFPPGTEPVIVESNVVNVGGFPDLQFVKRRMTLRDRNNAKYTQTQLNPLVLPGCGCVVSSPHDVAYVSDISGLPVCRRCASTCECGHKVAPRERVKIRPRSYMCVVCLKAEQRAQRWQGIKHIFLGSFKAE